MTPETKTEKTEAALPLFWAWITEYPDEGAEIVAAVDEETAHKRAMEFFNYGDPDDVTTKPVTEKDIDDMRESAEHASIDRARLLALAEEIAKSDPSCHIEQWQERARFAIEKANEWVREREAAKAAEAKS
jgi:hypothetical protein